MFENPTESSNLEEKYLGIDFTLVVVNAKRRWNSSLKRLDSITNADCESSQGLQTLLE